jgi:hypothetical protein
MLEPLFPSKRAAQVVEGLATKFAEANGLPDLDPNELFEVFAAYCIVSQYQADFDAEDLRSGGANDLGIDAYAVIINGAVYTEAEEVRAAIQAPKIDVHFVVVQAKRERTFSGDVFLGLATSINHLLSEKPEPFKMNDRVAELRDCLHEIYRDPGRFPHGREPRLSVWYASLGAFRPVRHRAKMDKARTDLLNSRYFSRVSVDGAGAHQLRELHHRAKSMESATFTMANRVELPKAPGVRKALFGVMPAREVVDRILLNERGERRKHIFEDNVRDFYGAEGRAAKVNAQIAHTLDDSDERQRFAVLNNGITIITRSLTKAGPKLHVKDPQVVNGCQTCNVLLEKRDKLTDDVLVGVRIVECDDEAVITSIITATNTQNALNPIDLSARQPFQRHLEDFFASQSLEPRLLYERRRNQYGAGHARSYTVTRRHLTQAYAAMWLDVPHAVTRYQSLVRDYGGRMFLENDDPLPYYTAAVALRRVIWVLANAERLGLEPGWRPARFQVLYGVRLRLLGDAPLPSSESGIAAACNQILAVMSDADAATHLVKELFPALRASLGSGVPRSLIGREARTPAFTQRFRQAVMQLPRATRAAA